MFEELALIPYGVFHGYIRVIFTLEWHWTRNGKDRSLFEVRLRTDGNMPAVVSRGP